MRLIEGKVGTEAFLKAMEAAGVPLRESYRVVTAFQGALGEALAVYRLVHHEQYERVLAATRAGLDEATFDAEWAAGRALDADGIAALAAEIAPARE